MEIKAASSNDQAAVPSCASEAPKGSTLRSQALSQLSQTAQTRKKLFP